MPRHYLHIDQGQGRVYDLPTTVHDAKGNERQVTAIGTSHCFTCVGIYIRLNSAGTKCFVAHISADLSNDSVDPLESRDHKIVRPNQEQSEALYARIKAKLNDTPELQQWAQSTDPAVIAQNILIVCPKAEDPQGSLLSGHHIVRAVQDFFKLDNVSPERAHGFCVEQDGTRTKANFTWNGVADTWPDTEALFKGPPPWPEPDTLESKGWMRGNSEEPDLSDWRQEGRWMMSFQKGRWQEGPYRCPGQ